MVHEQLWPTLSVFDVALYLLAVLETPDGTASRCGGAGDTCRDRPACLSASNATSHGSADSDQPGGSRLGVPAFTAEASLYQTRQRYRSFGFKSGDGPVGRPVVPAYHPGPETQRKCTRCGEIALRSLGICLAAGAIASIPCGPFYPACAGAALVACDLKLLGDMAACSLDDCCPKVCGAINPFDPGAGCCDANEQCVGRYDPNSRGGCCPSDQTVCAGKCCARGETCCGETCCPPGHFCRGGWICEPTFIGSFPTTPPPPPPVDNCFFGGAPCGGKCCPPGLQCCGVFNGQPDCRTSCIR